MADLFCPIISPEIEAKFWSRINREDGQGPNGDCWCWTGPLMPPPCNYPVGFNLKVNGKNRLFRASHVALAIEGKFRPSAEYQALHSCDHKPCVRPDHLRWGTEQENREDHFARTKKPHFTDDEIRDIRNSPERNFVLARKYGVTNPCIWNIRNRVSYRHVK